MAEILYIRLGSQAEDEIAWLIVNTIEQEIIASGELTSAKQLHELAEKAQQRVVKVFVPGCDVLLKSLTVPTKSQRAMRSAVPYMLEDELAQDVDQLFFAYANVTNSSSEHNCFVAVTQRAQMLQWQSWLKEADIVTKSMQPDVLAMPYVEGQYSAIALHSINSTAIKPSKMTQVVVRLGEWQGYTLDQDAWRFTLSNIITSPKNIESLESGQVITINAYSDLPFIDEVQEKEGVSIVNAEKE